MNKYYESFRIKQDPPTERDIQRWESQAKKIFDAFNEPRTMAQVAQITGIERANVCRRVADFKRDGTIKVICIDKDPLTKFRAQYFSTNPAYWPKPSSPQFDLFS